MQQEKIIELLVDLGLTPPQARTYLTLTCMGSATANEIHKLSKVARQDIYRILAELQRLSLVEKILAKPNKFKGVEIDEGTSILLGVQKKKISQLRAKAKEILKLPTPQLNKNETYEELQCIIIPSGKPHLRKFKESLQNSRISINAIVMWEGLLEGLTSKPKVFQDALDRGVKFRYMTTIPNKEQRHPKIFNSLKGDFQVRYLPASPPVLGAIVDQKEVFINIIPVAHITASSTLWSNNPSLIAMAKDYFELLWLTALEEIPEEH